VIRRVPTSTYVECAARTGDGPRCTLPAGHTGWHLACDDDGNELDTFPPRKDPR
jgi:hypothetical protein